MDGGQTILLLPVSTPAGTHTGGVSPGTASNGAVAELTQNDDGTITAEIRIPGPPVP